MSKIRSLIFLNAMSVYSGFMGTNVGTLVTLNVENVPKALKTENKFNQKKR